MSGIVTPPILQPFILPPKYSTETKIASIDFSDSLNIGETIVSIQNMSIFVIQGTDPNPNSMLTGTTTVIGNIVNQPVMGGIDGNIYNIAVSINTSLGQILTNVAQFGVVSRI